MKTVLILAMIFSAAWAAAAIPPFGTWEWVETEESLGVFTTPADVGYTVQYEFNEDMTCVEYRNQIMLQEGVFWVHDVEFMGLIITALTFDFGGVSPETCAFGFLESDLYMYWGAGPDGFPFFPVERYTSREPVDTENRSWGEVKSLYR